MAEKLKLYGFNNLTKSLSFNIYDVCYAKTEPEQRKYIDPYLLMYVLFMAGTSIMLHHFAYDLYNVVIGSFILYLIEINIAKNREYIKTQ